jgi:excisionase family DNA binding protein
MSRSAYDLRPAPTGHWTGRAACLGHDPQLWEVVGTKLTGDNETATRMCRRCPVRTDCHQLGVALGRGAEGMIFGGEVMPPDRWVSLRELTEPRVLSSGQAAEVLHLSPQTVRNACAEGRLPAVRDDAGRWTIRARDLRAFAAKGPPWTS